MLPFIDTAAEWILLGIVAGLLIVTLFAILLVLVIRYRLHWIESRKETIQEKLGDLVIRYISGDLPLDAIETEVRKRIDFISLMEVIRPLGDSLDGEEEDRLQALMAIEGIRSHFRHRLFHGTSNEQAKACLYYARLHSLPASMVPRFVQMTRSGSPHRQYAAATVVMVHGTVREKEEVLSRLIRHPRLTSMATIDLVINFTRYGEEYHLEEMTFLMDQICADDLPDERKALLVQALGELSYFHSLPMLLDCFRKVDPDGTHPDLQVAMIRVLTEFGADEILPALQVWGVNSSFADVRIATAAVLGEFRNPTSKALLVWMIQDPDYRVVLEAATSLARFPEVDLDRIDCHSLDPEEWDDLKGEVQPEKEHEEENG